MGRQQALFAYINPLFLFADKKWYARDAKPEQIFVIFEIRFRYWVAMHEGRRIGVQFYSIIRLLDQIYVEYR